MRGYDVRAVANIFLEEARRLGVGISNLHLNKAIYFMHVDTLRDKGAPLVSAKIEAWEHGPVFREIYNQFKVFKRAPIERNAQKVDFDTGLLIDADFDFPASTEDWIRQLCRFYAMVPAHVLYDVSHAKGGAWDHVYNKSGAFNVGMEITEDLIRQLEIPKGQRITLQ
ncbi:hypothetical protein CDO87_07260 [Sagittula sp. P11]|uniref:Panacea domain-containing protein n=1 Tax=Sagittula sp. P11 TaxID=2009329 RepID=UPI000C2D0DD5|nr:type II toxin-antitoxin system antitoxin SocA domain-containing protein [Sagittula sp. P11]AUC53007.1 hypothetical protein CDO87_07260 [Sagittula sp. P11]